MINNNNIFFSLMKFDKISAKLPVTNWYIVRNHLTLDDVISVRHIM